MFDPGYLRQFTGEYETPGATMTVALQGNQLVTISPGSPARKLAPKHGSKFEIVSRPGQTVEFKPDSVVIYTPDEVYAYRKKI